jgi:D-psicose/D-tagatose/L-ribulose 3-epimerase
MNPLGVHALVWAGGWSEADARRAVAATAAAGFDLLEIPVLEPETVDAGRAHCVESLAWLAERAAADGITLGVEVVNRYESNLLNTAEQALALLDEIGAPNLVVHLDTYHMNIEEQDFATPIQRCGERLGYVHVGESNRGYLGTGTIDFEQFFAALRGIGYQGIVTFESFSSAVVSPTLSNTLAVWRNLWDDGEDLARAARRFMLEGLGDPSRTERVR